MRNKIITATGIILVIIIMILLIFSPKSPKKSTSEITPSPILSAEPISSPTQAPDTPEERSDAPYNEWQKALDYYRREDPEFFLANKIPYKTTSFAAARHYITGENAHWSFIITLNGKSRIESLRQARAWLLSLGLSEEQIKKLDITYQ